MSKLLVYASKGGDTKIVAKFIAEELGFDSKDAADLDCEDLARNEAFIFAVSTHGDGQIFENFCDKLPLLNQTDMNGRKVALVGVGNQERHGEDFCSGLAAFLPNLKKATLVGQTDGDGYKFSHSRAFINGKFIGLVVDFKGDNNWKERAKKWCDEMKGQI